MSSMWAAPRRGSTAPLPGTMLVAFGSGVAPPVPMRALARAQHASLPMYRAR